MSVLRLLLITLLCSAPAMARESVAVWLGSQSEPAALELFRQQWQQQSGQPLVINMQTLADNSTNGLPAQTWFAVSADDGSDRALLNSRFHGVIVSLRAERARVLNDIAPQNRTRWTGIYADPSPQQILSVIHAFYPQQRHIGVVFDRRYTSLKTEWLNAALHHKKNLQGLYLHEGEQVERVLGMLLPRADIIVLMAHSDLYSAANVDHIALQSMHQGKIVIAGGETAIRSGAVLNVTPDAQARIKQAVALSLLALRNEHVGFREAQQHRLLINQQVLRTLNQTLDTDNLSHRVDFPLTLQQDDSE